MNFSFWWFSASDELASNELASDELASDDVITSRALCLQEQLSLDAFKFPFCLFLCSLLFFQNLLMISNFFVYGPVHLNKY